MIRIKCNNCGVDIDIPNKNNKCLTCGTPVIKSIDSKVKELEVSDLKKKQAAREITKLQKTMKKKMAANQKLVNNELVKAKLKAAKEIKAMPSDTSPALMQAVVEKANKEQDEIFNLGIRQAEAILQEHTDEVEKIALEADIEPPQVSMNVRKLSTSDESKIKREAVKNTVTTIQYAGFFLITPFGMLVFEEHTQLGLLIIVSGILNLPPLTTKLLDRFKWLSLFNLILMTHVVLLASVIALAKLGI